MSEEIRCNWRAWLFPIVIFVLFILSTFALWENIEFPGYPGITVVSVAVFALTGSGVLVFFSKIPEGHAKRRIRRLLAVCVLLANLGAFLYYEGSGGRVGILPGNSPRRYSATIALLRTSAQAIETFRKDRGEYPSDLSALRESLKKEPENYNLRSVPKDPFSRTREPFRYVRQEESWILYSVGPDGDDDQGKCMFSVGDVPSSRIDRQLYYYRKISRRSMWGPLKRWLDVQRKRWDGDIILQSIHNRPRKGYASLFSIS